MTPIHPPAARRHVFYECPMGAAPDPGACGRASVCRYEGDTDLDPRCRAFWEAVASLLAHHAICRGGGVGGKKGVGGCLRLRVLVNAFVLGSSC